MLDGLGAALDALPAPDELARTLFVDDARATRLWPAELEETFAAGEIRVSRGTLDDEQVTALQVPARIAPGPVVTAWIFGCPAGPGCSPRRPVS